MVYFDWIAGIGALGSIATAVGVWIAAKQLSLSRRQETTRFEDGLVQQYRELLNHIPVSALLGQSLKPDELASRLDDFYRYFDLCNEQAFLRQQQRITEQTWAMWCDGIRTNMARPAFAAAWEEVKVKSDGDFSELRWIENTGYRGDPRELPQHRDTEDGQPTLRRAA